MPTHLQFPTVTDKELASMDEACLVPLYWCWLCYYYRLLRHKRKHEHKQTRQYKRRA